MGVLFWVVTGLIIGYGDSFDVYRSDQYRPNVNISHIEETFDTTPEITQDSSTLDCKGESTLVDSSDTPAIPLSILPREKYDSGLESCTVIGWLIYQLYLLFMFSLVMVRLFSLFMHTGYFYDGYWG